MELEIEIEEIEDCVILRLDGRLDASTTPLLEMKLNTFVEEKHHKILMDFTGVEYLSSAGIRLILSTTKKLSVKKGGLAIFSLDEDVMSVIKMAGFEKIFHIFTNEQDALQYAAQL